MTNIDSKISVVAPMFNEEENLTSTLYKIHEELKSKGIPNYEIIFVNDGSTDNTWDKAKELARSDEKLKVIGYATNTGRGKALRTGIEAATGDIIVTIDFDLTYDASHIGRMIDTLNKNENVDVVLASCYMPGGKTIGIPPFRLFVSKMANSLYQYAYSPRIYTSTCVVRAYRRNAVKNLELTNDDKEIHLEILSKLLACGYKVREIPATLERRAETKKGRARSSFKFKAHSVSHILYFIQEKPFYIFGLIGSILFLSSFGVAAILVYSRFGENPEFNNSFLSKISSPALVASLMLSGIQLMGLGFLGIQNNILKKEIFRTQKMMKETRQQTKSTNF
jgi:glycosyltransferase involved in cell wall biosynthesis